MVLANDDKDDDDCLVRHQATLTLQLVWRTWLVAAGNIVASIVAGLALAGLTC